MNATYRQETKNTVLQNTTTLRILLAKQKILWLLEPMKDCSAIILMRTRQ